MEYGSRGMKAEKLFRFQGFNPATANLTDNKLGDFRRLEAINQRDADLLFLWHRYKQLGDGSEKRAEILREFTEKIAHRAHLDRSVELIGKFLFGLESGPEILSAVRASGNPLVDDWACLKTMVSLFESRCGSLTQYGMKYMRAFANICNGGVSPAAMEAACEATCGVNFKDI